MVKHVRRHIVVKEDVYAKLEKLKKELGVQTFNDVIEALVATYESLKVYEDSTKLLQNLKELYNIWQKTRQVIQSLMQ